MDTLRIIDVIPERDLDRISPKKDGESTEHQRLRILHSVVPWTKGNFSLYYLLSDDELLNKLRGFDLIPITRLICIVYLSDDLSMLVDLLITYGKEYLINLLWSIYKIPNWQYQLFTRLCARALYRIDKRFYLEFDELRERGEFIWFDIVKGVVYECVLKDDMETFMDINDDEASIYIINPVLEASVKTNSTKYIIEIIDYVAINETLDNEDMIDAYYQIMSYANEGSLQYLAQVIIAILEHSGWSLEEFLHEILTDTQHEVKDQKNIYSAFYILGLPFSKIVDIVESFPANLSETYTNWKENFLSGDV